jgi:hypothetical protein
MVILEGGININNRPFILSAIRWRGVAAIFACIMDGTTPGPPQGKHEQQDTSTALSLYGSGVPWSATLFLIRCPSSLCNVCDTWRRHCLSDEVCDH